MTFQLDPMGNLMQLKEILKFNRYITWILLFTIVLSTGCKRKKKSSNAINVEDFGARGDDRKDDTYSIQKALDYAKMKNNATVYFPKGEYIVSRTKVAGQAFCLFVHSGTSIKGEDQDKTRIVLQKGQRTYTRIMYFDGQNDLEICNLTLDGNYLNQPQKNGKFNEHMHGLFIQASTNIRIDNCAFVNTAGDGIVIRGLKDRPSQGLNISNCYFAANQRNGLTLGSGFVDVTVKNNEFSSTIRVSPIDSEPEHGYCRKVVIDSNTFNGKAGKVLTLGGHVNVSDYLVSNNSFENVSIFMVRTKDVIIKDNVFNTNQRNKPLFYMLNGVENVRIENNQVSSTIKVLSAIATKRGAPSNIQFKNNSVRMLGSSFGNPFILQGCNNVDISNNEITSDVQTKVPLFLIKATSSMADIRIEDNDLKNFEVIDKIVKIRSEWPIDKIEINNNISDKK